MNDEIKIKSVNDDDYMRKLLLESLEREKQIKRLYDEEVIKNDQLKLELEIEKKKENFIKGMIKNII
jgi:hypothetical protein